MDALSKLNDLAAQERVKTATLRASARAFVAELTKSVGEYRKTEVEIQGRTMKLARMRLVDTSSGQKVLFWCFWILGRGYFAIDAEVGQELLHPEISDPTEAKIPVIDSGELIEFSRVAQEFTETLIRRYEEETEQVNAAIATLGGAR